MSRLWLAWKAIIANHEKNVPFEAVAEYYLNFTIYFAHLLFPLFIFLSIIWFTSKLANNTEIVAFLSSGVSFYRFLKPYFIGASIVAFLALILGLYLAPKASKGFNEFTYKYLKSHRKPQQTTDIYRQINDDDFVYVSNYDAKNKRGSNFTFEHFEGDKIKVTVRKWRYCKEIMRVISRKMKVKNSIFDGKDILIYILLNFVLVKGHIHGAG